MPIKTMFRFWCICVSKTMYVSEVLFLFPPRQKPEKLSVGSMLFVVSLMAVGACVTSLAFGKLSVSIIARILSSINLPACFFKAFCDQTYHGLYILFWKLYIWMMAPSHLQDIVYNRPKTLDSTFDAGGDTSSTLIAVSNMCEFVNIQTILGQSRICASLSTSKPSSVGTWSKQNAQERKYFPGSSTMMLQYGISGSFWYKIFSNIYSGLEYFQVHRGRRHPPDRFCHLVCLLQVAGSRR